MIKLNYLLGFMLLLSACTPVNSKNYCSKLEKSIESAEVQKYLTNWVDETFNRNTILRTDVTSINNVRPGYYSYKGKQFDWDILGFENRSRNVQLIGIDVHELVEKTIPKASNDFSKYKSKQSVKTNLVKSIFFANKRGHGILVKLKHSDTFIEDNKIQFTKKVSDRIAVFCKKSRYSKSYYDQDG